MTKQNGPGDQIALKYGAVENGSMHLPCIVLLDANDTVLFRGTPPFDRDGLENLLNRYH